MTKLQPEKNLICKKGHDYVNKNNGRNMVPV